MYRLATNRTPEADFTLSDGRTMKLEGVSMTNDNSFYQDIINGTKAEPGLESILENWLGDKLTLHVRLTRISTPCQRGLKGLFDIIEANGKAEVHWHWISDDLESQRVGEFLNNHYNPQPDNVDSKQNNSERDKSRFFTIVDRP